jgi:DNA primase catalytic core
MTEHPRLPSDTRERLVLANRRAITYYRRQLYAPAGAAARTHLRQRGFGDLLAAGSPWAVGFAPPAWQGVTRYLLEQGFTEQDLVDSGLAFRSEQGRLLDRFRDRVAFAIRNPDGEPVGFIGRALHPDDETPKYINPPATPLYAKKETLFGLAEQAANLTAGSRVVAVEGPFDAVAVALAAGRQGYVGLATCGTALSREHLAILGSLPGQTAFGFDGDAAGDRAAERAGELVREVFPHRTVLGITFPRGDDPAAMLEHHGPAQLRTTLERAAMPLEHLVVTRRAAELLEHAGTSAESDAARVAIARQVAEYAADRYHPASPEAALAFRLTRLLRLDLTLVSGLIALAAAPDTRARPPTLGTPAAALAASATSNFAPEPGPGHLPPAPWRQRRGPTPTNPKAPIR